MRFVSTAALVASLALVGAAAGEFFSWGGLLLLLSFCSLSSEAVSSFLFLFLTALNPNPLSFFPSQLPAQEIEAPKGVFGLGKMQEAGGEKRREVQLLKRRRVEPA